MDRRSSFEAHTLLCALSVCAAEPSCIVAPVQSFLPPLPPSCLKCGLVVFTSEAGRVCACRGLYWAQATAHVYRSSGDLGIGASPDLQKAQWGTDFRMMVSAMKEWDGNKAQSQLLGSFCTLILTQHVVYLQKWSICTYMCKSFGYISNKLPGSVQFVTH